MLDYLLAGFIALTVHWAQPYALQNEHIILTAQTKCLTEAIYYESRNEDTIGMAAVAYVVLNRTTTRDKSICEVVHQRSQFSFYKPNIKLHPQEPEAWIKATYIAIYTQLGVITNPIGNATMFSESMMASWDADAVFSKKIKHHYFYTEKFYLRKPMLRQTK